MPADKIFGMQSNFRYFCPPKFCPIKNLNDPLWQRNNIMYMESTATKSISPHSIAVDITSPPFLLTLSRLLVGGNMVYDYGVERILSRI